jgi:Na+(H+)/acetate symporter ActP
MTAADFVRGRYGYRGLELAVAFTSILATMPYIALQLVGLEKVILALGVTGQGILVNAPLTKAFVILALYTYKSGLRAPAMIAFVKDTMIYIFIISAIVYIPYKLGGFGAVFEAAGKSFAAKTAVDPKTTRIGCSLELPSRRRGETTRGWDTGPLRQISTTHTNVCPRAPPPATKLALATLAMQLVTFRNL